MRHLPGSAPVKNPGRRTRTTFATAVIGAIAASLTGVFAAPSLGGSGIYDYVANGVSPEYSITGQLITQATGVATTVIWSGVVAFIVFKLIDLTIGLRVSEEDEREGLDTTAHGEAAYRM